MASLLQIRNVPDEDRRALKARAAARWESLNSYVLGLLSREVARLTVEEVLSRAARRSERARASAVEVLDAARAEREGTLRRRSDVIVADCSALVDALSAVAGSDELRAELAAEELHAPGLSTTSSPRLSAVSPCRVSSAPPGPTTC